MKSSKNEERKTNNNKRKALKCKPLADGILEYLD